MAVREMSEREENSWHAGMRTCPSSRSCSRQPTLRGTCQLWGWCRRRLFVFSLARQRIDWLRSNRNACLQVEENGEHHRWKSVELPDPRTQTLTRWLQSPRSAKS